MLSPNDLAELLPKNNPALCVLRNCDMGIPFHNQRIIHEMLDGEGYKIVSKVDLESLLTTIKQLKKLHNDTTNNINN